MKKHIKYPQILIEPTVIIVDIIIILIFTSCTTSNLKISEFKFVYDNQSYLVRSAYCSGNPESCNQLIGDKFIAVDMNQDRIIDNVNEGNVSLAEAQEIYDYCLSLLEKQNKLSEVNRHNKMYTLSESDYDYEIKTFYPKLGLPFNEFTITDRKNSIGIEKTSILIDNGANGTLNEILKGRMTIANSQLHYSKIILKGIEEKDLIKKNESIIVK